jgi:hypothetical protein
VPDYIYWIISPENDHRHHHKFIKYEKRLRKEGKNMFGLPIKENFCQKDPKLVIEIIVQDKKNSNLFIWPSMWTRLEHAHYLETINNMWFLGKRESVNAALSWFRSNGPTDPLHISCICFIWKIPYFYSSFSLNPSKSAFFHALTLSLLPKNHMMYKRGL